MENGQTSYKSRTLTRNLWQPAQESNSIINNNQPRRPTYCLQVRLIRSHITISSKQSRQPNHNSCNNWPQTARTWLKTAGFQISVPTSNLGLTGEESQTWLTSHFGCFASSQPACNFLMSIASNQGTHTFPLFHCKAGPLLCFPWSLCQIQVMVADSLALNK